MMLTSTEKLAQFMELHLFFTNGTCFAHSLWFFLMSPAVEHSQLKPPPWMAWQLVDCVIDNGLNLIQQLRLATLNLSIYVCSCLLCEIQNGSNCISGMLELIFYSGTDLLQRWHTIILVFGSRLFSYTDFCLCIVKVVFFFDVARFQAFDRETATMDGTSFGEA